MPLFDWDTSGSHNGNKFWIYWATTLPATILVLAVWRVWYVFDEWRQTHGTKNTCNDMRLWIKTGRSRKIVSEPENAPKIP